MADEKQDVIETRKASTRDAVETSIGMAKEDKSSTWESHFVKGRNRIARWGRRGRSAQSRRAEG